MGSTSGGGGEGVSLLYYSWMLYMYILPCEQRP